MNIDIKQLNHDLACLDIYEYDEDETINPINRARKALEQQQAEIERLKNTMVKVHDDLIMRSQDNIVELSDGIWMQLCDDIILKLPEVKND